MLALLNQLLGRDIFDYLYHLSDLTLFFLLSCVTVTLSLIIALLSKKFILFKIRYSENNAIGHIGLIIGMIYAVLVAVMALYLNNVNTSAADAVTQEANAAANIYRYNGGLKGPTKETISAHLKNYLHEVIDKEWPLMEAGKDVNFEGNQLIDSIFDQLNAYPLSTPSQSILVNNMMEELNHLYSARQQRILLSFSELSPETWEVILIGTILIMAFTYLFKVNLYLHVAAVFALAFMASSVLFLLVTLDRPFQGEFIVEPDSLKSLLTYIQQKEGDTAALHKNLRISK